MTDSSLRTVGVAAQDVAAAELLHDLAVEHGVGRIVNLGVGA